MFQDREETNYRLILAKEENIGGEIVGSVVVIGYIYVEKRRRYRDRQTRAP